MPDDTPAEAAPGAAPEDYNAMLVGRRACHDQLIVLRVRPDAGVPAFSAGQYTVLGLRRSAPRAEGGDAGRSADDSLIRRAYSICSPLFDEDGVLASLGEIPFWEFCVALVQRDDSPPALTPRLFALRPGDRLHCSPRPRGRYTLAGVPPSSNLFFAATGTGEAPHNAMLAELAGNGHQGQVVNVTCVRRKIDLAYLEQHRRLERQWPNYRYIPLTTREPENLDRSLPDYQGKRYIQDYVTSGALEREVGWPLQPGTTHAFLCGNPAMIGAPRDGDAAAGGMVAVLQDRGFVVDQPRRPGNLHFEQYWQ